MKRPTKRAKKKATRRITRKVVRRPVKRAVRRSARSSRGRSTKAVKRPFRRGDTVMHWTYGLGTIVKLENRELEGKKTLYYAVQVGDMTVWVPNDEHLGTRVRKPSSKGQLGKLRNLLGKPGVTLPQDRHERKTMLFEMLKDGRAESLVKVIRSLVVYGKNHPLNDNDQALLKRAQTALLAEWSHALGLAPEQAEAQLHRLIGIPTPTVTE